MADEVGEGAGALPPSVAKNACHCDFEIVNKIEIGRRPILDLINYKMGRTTNITRNSKRMRIEKIAALAERLAPMSASTGIANGHIGTK
jgi:hypothetical protein